MIRRMLLLAAALVVVIAAPAYAQYNPGVTTTVNPNGTATFTACCYQPGSTVTFSVGGVVIGTSAVNAAGVATGTFAVPAGVAAGTNTVTAAGTGSTGAAVTETGSVVVGGTTATTAVTGLRLPATGSSPATVPIGLIAVGLVVAGSLALLGARRRDSSSID
jgi:hypothetical protein